jgi:hypothetical protein
MPHVRPTRYIHIEGWLPGSQMACSSRRARLPNRLAPHLNPIDLRVESTRPALGRTDDHNRSLDQGSLGRTIARPTRRTVRPASDVAYVLMDFIKAGRATAHPDHADVVDLESTVSGDVLIDLLRETEKRTDRSLTEADGRPTINCVNQSHRYQIRFIEY